MTLLKTPPHSLDAERSVLGSILIDGDVLHRIALEESEFYSSVHRIVYRAMRECSRQGKAVDLIVVGEHLDAAGQLDDIGGIAYLVEIQDETPTAANAESYAAVVSEKAKLREGISIGNLIAQAGYDRDLDAMTSMLSDGLMKLSGNSRDQWDANSSLREVLVRIDRVHSGEEKPGLPFCIECLDQKYPGGMKPGDLIIIGARPSMGKTSVILNQALRLNVPVGIASLETTHQALTTRELVMLSQIPFDKIDTAKMSQPEWDRFGKAAAKLSEKDIHIFDQGGATIGEIVRQATTMRHKQGIELFIVDYLQLIDASGHGSNRNEEIGYISRQLKSLAKRLGIPIIALSQLNRELEKRGNKRPTMADLRESGQIEQDADMIIMLYRDAMYNEVPDNTIEFLVEKCKNGPVSYSVWGWDSSLMMLRSPQREVYSSA